MKLKAILITIILIITMGNFNAFAYELPSSYWSLNDNYAKAVEADNYAATIDYGVKILNLMAGEPKNEQTKNIIGSRSYNVAFAYFLTGDYENAAKYFNMYIPYGKEFGWDDGVIIAENCAKQFKSVMDVYQLTDTPQKVYGVKNEPNGVLYGQTSERMQEQDSMVLLYLEYGDTSDATFSWAKSILSKAQNQGKAVELALNFLQEGNTARSVNASDSYLSSLYSMLSEYSSVPIYLRIGAEFNIWSTKCTPNEFISAFRVITDNMKRLPNVSTIWSMAHTSTWKSADFPYTADDFYPGDSYVDWVGINCYPMKHFLGKTWQGKSKFNEVCYKAGYAADPVLMIKDAVDTYGDRKPIMITECGSAHTTNGEINKSDDAWGVYYLQQIYAFIPIVYPQVKAIAYFNTRVPNEIAYFDLEGSGTLKAAYNSLVQNPWFIQNKSTNTANAFFKKADSTISAGENTVLCTYPHLYGSDSVTVEYYLDGKLEKSTSEIPYSITLGEMLGSHTLKVVAKGNNGASMTREYKLISTKKAENADEFSDTSGLNNTQKDAVNYVLQKDIITGYEDNTLAPNNTITRAEFATIICRAMGYNASDNCTFDDAKNHWGSKYIKACVDIGAINGIGGNKFAPDSNVTLEQAVKILTVVCGYATDKASYPQGFMDAAAKNNILDNLTSDKVGLNLKRIDAAMMIYNAFK